MRRARAIRAIPAALVATTAAAAPPALSAQDFLFGAPLGSVTFRAGRLFARSEGGVSAHTFRNLTVEPEDLNAFALGADLAIRVAERADLVAGVGFSYTRIPSEFRDRVDENDQPIRQGTSFHQVPLTLGARLYVTPRGHAISRFAWIPARAALYVAGGAGPTARPPPHAAGSMARSAAGPCHPTRPGRCRLARQGRWRRGLAAPAGSTASRG